MHVLFLAVGGTRRRAVVEESARAVADGHRVTVVVDRIAQWTRDQFPAGVTVVELALLEQRLPALRIEQAVFFKAPRRVVRTVGRGPLRDVARRAGRSYETRVAARAHRVFLRAWGGARAQARLRLVAELVERGPGVDLVVASDPVAMPFAARVATGAGRVSSQQVCFSYDYSGRTSATQHRPVPNAVQGDNS
ncbi:hypothetical protein GA0070618_0120 [Micromonospora echinospora]|uniref:Uncharacterized protein n=1 Tax=Micromonospora echinospora TaxID=1877 RepID=A0A1C4U933_MICEC|nr:hypothetical protein [Micromonospora echinospora]SCE68161.1 hypothetical protein GA0070618_0120 [Micromonospora echinospora]